MWISALITAAAYSLKVHLHNCIKKEMDIYIEGPSYYIEYGMHQKDLQLFMLLLSS